MRQCAQCELHTLSFHPFIKRFKSVSFQVDVPINRTLYVWFSYLSRSFMLSLSFPVCIPLHHNSIYSLSLSLFRSILYLQLALSWCVTEYFFPITALTLSFLTSIFLCISLFLSFVSVFSSFVCLTSISLFTVFMSDSISIARYICESNGT